MSETNPGVLANHLQGFRSDLDHWASNAHEVSRAADRRQRQSAEATERSTRTVQGLVHHASELQVLVTRTEREVEQQHERTGEVMLAAQQIYRSAEQANALASATLQHWQHELDLARAWLEQALSELAAAEAALRDAIAQLRRAENKLDSAQRRLRDKRHEGRASYWDERAVSEARNAVSSAQSVVAAARHAVEAARIEVERARARVACCERAVSFAERAVAQAVTAKATAGQGVAEAERAGEYVASAKKASTEALASFGQHDVAVKEARSAVQLARKATDRAQTFAGHVSRHDSNVQVLSRHGGSAINEKISYLHELDRTMASLAPTLMNAAIYAAKHPIRVQFLKHGTAIRQTATKAGAVGLAAAVLAAGVLIPDNMPQIMELSALRGQLNSPIKSVIAKADAAKRQGDDLVAMRDGLLELKDVMDGRRDFEEWVRKLNRPHS